MRNDESTRGCGKPAFGGEYARREHRGTCAAIGRSGALLSRMPLALTVILALAGGFTSEGRTQGLPNTEVEIEAAIRALGAKGGTVTVAPGVVLVDDGIRVPSNIVLKGSGTPGAPLTTLRLRRASRTYVVQLGSRATGNAIENIIIDGSRAQQGADLAGEKAALILLCTDCRAKHVQVINAMYDGVQVSDALFPPPLVPQNVLIDQSSANGVGRFGFFTTSTAYGVRIYNSQAENTGLIFTTQGPGAGFGVGGKSIELRNLTTSRTNGDGVAGYASTNSDITVRDSVFNDPRNHCVHLGGDRPVIVGNECYRPRLSGYFIANDSDSPDREAFGGRILDNYAEDAGTYGVNVELYKGNTIVRGNRVNRSFLHNYTVVSSSGVTVTENVGRFPGTQRDGQRTAGNWCHLNEWASTVSHPDNNFKGYAGATRPEFCRKDPTP